MSDKKHLLLLAQNLEGHLDELDGNCEVHRYYDAEDKPGLLKAIGDKVTLVGTNGHDGCPRDIMAQLPNLEMIGCYGVGYDAIDIVEAKRRGIRVTNTPDVLSDAVAELAVGLMVALARQIPQSDRFVREGKWTPSNGYPLTSELTGRTVGILGLGRIGQEIALRLQGMKMRVVYHGRTEQKDKPFVYFSDLETMASKCDWLVVSMPGSPGTEGIVSESVLRALGPDGRFVNVARGNLVDESALIRLLQSGELGGAALDVFENEPTVPESLRQMDQVVLSPHAASATHKTRAGMGSLVIRNFLAHINGDPLITQVV